MITFKHRGNLSKTTRFLEKARKLQVRSILEKYAKQGVAALSSATPVDSGLTASSWDYTIEQTRSGYSIEWTNSNVNAGVPIAILLQYGHATGNGGYVSGRDYINPAIRPIMEKIPEEIWKEVTNI